jgi:hypothetical protein
LIPEPDPNSMGLVVTLAWIIISSGIFFFIITRLPKFAFHSLFLFVINAIIIITVVILFMPNEYSEWQEQVQDEIDISTCTELAENYKAYENESIRKKIVNEYVIDCVATEKDMMILLEALR